MLPNQEMVKSSIRSLILAAMGALGGYGVAKGWYSAENLSSVLNSEFVLGVIGWLITAGYGVFMNRSQGLVNAAAAVTPQVTIIAPAAVAAASPSPNVVAAGTAAAKDAAKA